MGGMVAQHCECSYCHKLYKKKFSKMISFMSCIFYHNKNKQKVSYEKNGWQQGPEAVSKEILFSLMM